MTNGSNRESSRILKIYTIVEKPGSQKGIWLEIGVGSENRDGSLRGKLDALPTNGTIHIREYEPHNKETVRQNGDTKPHSKWQQGEER